MIEITDSAIKQMKDQLVKRGTPEASIRFGIRGGGCTGYSYVFEFTENPKEKDTIIENDGVRIFIDPKSMIMLNGTTIDFETVIRGHGFKFDNPNVKQSCGCGESIVF